MHGTRSKNPKLVSIELDQPHTQAAFRALNIEDNIEDIEMAENQGNANAAVAQVLPRPLREYYNPTTYTNASPIRLPDAPAQHYTIDTRMLQVLPEFHGSANQNPYHHLTAFISICATCRLPNLTSDVLRLVLFPFSLKDKAKQWLDSLTPDSITTWEQLEAIFLKKYFPVGKTNQIRRAITSFKQIDTEEFHETWERLKELIRSCPHHNVPRWQLVQAFYDGLTTKNRQFVDASCGGTFMHKSEDEAWELFENLSDNSLQHAQADRLPMPQSKKGGINEVNQAADLKSTIENLARQVSQLIVEKNMVNQITSKNEPCSICFIHGHFANDCPSRIPENLPEQVNVLNAPYNPNFVHPNLRYGNSNFANQSSSNFQTQQQRPFPNTYQNNNYVPFSSRNPNQNPPFNQQHVKQNTVNFDIQRELNEIKKAHHDSLHELNQRFGNHEQAFKRLETTVGQLVTTISQREKGKMPMQPEQQSRNVYEASTSSPQSQVNAVTTLRSGRKVDNRIGNSTPNDQGDGEIPPPPSGEPFVPPPPSEDEDEQPCHSAPPFPKALKDITPSDKSDKYKETMEVFKQVTVNIPLLDAIKQIPTYAKFLKDLCTKKRKTQQRVPKKVMLTEHVSSIIQDSLPQKYKDPGTPNIKCTIGDQTFDKTLLDLGASVNLIPYSTYKQLNLGNLRPTRVTLQLADRSVRVPRGVVEDVLIKVDKFVFPVDFVVLDIDTEHMAQVPIILGRPFLATADVKINCRTGVMKFSFGNLKAKLNVFENFENPKKGEVCSLVDVHEEISNQAPKINNKAKGGYFDSASKTNHQRGIPNAILEPG